MQTYKDLEIKHSLLSLFKVGGEAESVNKEDVDSNRIWRQYITNFN